MGMPGPETKRSRVFGKIPDRDPGPGTVGFGPVQTGSQSVWDRTSPTLAWREALGPSDNPSARLKQAHGLLSAPGIHLDQATKNFVSSPEGMRLVTKANSLIQHRGNKVVHPMAVPQCGQFEGPVKQNPFASDHQGLLALLAYVCSTP